jgi:hypothetical protein
MAENAGKRLQVMLRKMNSDRRGGTTWVELLPHAIRIQMDTPGKTGLSPYHIVTGRERTNLTARHALDIPTPRWYREGVDDREYARYMNHITEWVTDEMNKAHKHSSERVNERRRDRVSFQAGDKVWTLVPRTPIGPVSGSKIDNRWYGPRIVVERLSEHTYKVQVSSNPSHIKVYHVGQMKPYVDDALVKNMTQLWYSAPPTKRSKEEDQEEDYEIEKVVRVEVDVRTGRRRYEVKWVDHDYTTWEYMEGFILDPFGEFMGRSPEVSIDFPREWKLEVGEDSGPTEE